MRRGAPCDGNQVRPILHYHGEGLPVHGVRLLEPDAASAHHHVCQKQETCDESAARADTRREADARIVEEVIEHDGEDDAAGGCARDHDARGKGTVLAEVVGDDAEGWEKSESQSEAHTHCLGEKDLGTIMQFRRRRRRTGVDLLTW